MADDADLAQLITEVGVTQTLNATSRQLSQPGRETCVDCGEKIELCRLQALPSATRCLSCQHSRELNGQ